ncbi:SDR family oxidoreductase [soil metagenome]
MKVCVTGGAGFIGSHVAQAHLDAGYEVVIIDNLSTGKHDNVPQGARLIELDITDPAIARVFADERFDVLNHHAAHMELRVSVEDPVMDATTNVLGSLRLLEAAHRSGVQHVVFASSGGAVYGDQLVFPADETHPTRPISPYGVSKRSVELYLDYYESVHGMTSTILRYTNVYGPRQNPFGEAGVIAIFLQKWIDGQTAVINGDGEQTRDYVYVGDVARANLFATQQRMRGAYNCCTGIETSLNDLVDNLRQSYGGEAEIRHGDGKPGDLRRNVCSFEKLQNASGWNPAMSLKEGVQHTADWFLRRQ